MKRWNGWGDASVTHPFPPSAEEYLTEQVGPGTPLAGTRLEDYRPPAPRFPDHPLVTTDVEDRVRHARGQSLPDLIRLRAGTVPAFPDGVAYPADEDQVRELIAYAREAGARLIPYGGGTSVVGGVSVLPDAAPVLTVDLRRMKHLTGRRPPAC